MIEMIPTIVSTFLMMMFGVPFLLGILKLFGFYTIVQERQCRAFVLFGKVLAVIDEPGLHFLLFEIGPAVCQ